jgi:hypothetical protein
MRHNTRNSRPETGTKHHQPGKWQRNGLFTEIATIGSLGLALVLATSSTSRADDASNDSRVRAKLNDAIDSGVPMFNNGDAIGCYQVYRGSLLQVLSLLDSRPALKDSVQRSLDKSAREHDATEKAWILRRAIDLVLESMPG